MSVVELSDYRQLVERAHLRPPRPANGLPPARRASELPDPAPVAWLIEEVLPAGELGLLVGDGGAFKSSVAIHLALAIAGGHRVFDLYRTRQQPVLIVSAEDHRDVVLMRAKAFCAGHQWPATALQELYILAEGAPSLGDAAWCAHLQQEVERIRPGLIVLDPWAELQGGDENSNTDVRPAIKYLRRLGESVGAAVLLVHHAGKTREGGRPLDRIRGATALPSAARVIWFFDFQDEGLVVENLKHSRAPRLPAFHLEREIHTATDNRAAWLSARLGVRRVVSEHEEKILAQLRLAPEGARSFNELAELVAIRRTALAGVLENMVRGRVLTVREGRRNARVYAIRPTDSDDWFPLVPTGSETSREGPDEDPSATQSRDRFPLVPTGSGTSRAPHALSPDALVPETPLPPLRGEGFGNQSRGGGAASQFDPDFRLPPSTREPVAGTSREPAGNQWEPVPRVDDGNQSREPVGNQWEPVPRVDDGNQSREPVGNQLGTGGNQLRELVDLSPEDLLARLDERRGISGGEA